MKYNVSLRFKLTFWYSAIVALSLAAYGVYMYISVASQLHANLDASIVNVSASIDHIIQKSFIESQDAKKYRYRRRYEALSADRFSLFREDEKRRFVGPLRPGTDESSDYEEQDIVWSAIFEHILLDPRNYYIQIADSSNHIVWRSKNLESDTLPLISHTYSGKNASHDTVLFDSRNLYSITSSLDKHQKQNDSIFTNIKFRGGDLRLLIKRSAHSIISVGYTANDIESTLRMLFVKLLIALPLILLVSMAGGIFLSKLSLRQVDEITRTANEITAKHLSKRLAESSVDDEIGRLSRTLNEMIERLEHSFEQIRQFTSDASHEMRTPLTILRGELEIALHNQMSTEEYEIVIASALEEAARLSNVVETLLELSRADSGQVDMNFKRDNISNLLMDIFEDAEILAENKMLSVQKNIPDALYFDFDSARLHQAVLNLIDNAIKYTPQGGEVALELRADEEYVEIEISDTGMGMEQNELEHIFDRFYRVDKARSSDIKGIGLGLSIVKWIVDAHHGRIDVKSQPDRGSVFILRFPITQK